MRRTPDFETGCVNKYRYRNRGEALKAAASGKKFDLGSKRRLEPYRCPFCSHWHIGKARHRGGEHLKPFDKRSRRRTRTIMVNYRHGEL